MSNQPNTPPPYPPRRFPEETQGERWGEYASRQSGQQPCPGQPGAPGQQTWQGQPQQPYGYGAQQQPPYGYGQQPPQSQPYGYGQQQPPYGYGQQPAPQPWQPYGVQQPRSNSMGIIGFIFALLSIFCGWIPIAGWIVWLVGAVFSFIGLFSRPRGLAIAGVVISLVLIPLIITVLIALNAASDILFYDL